MLQFSVVMAHFSTHTILLKESLTKSHELSLVLVGQIYKSQSVGKFSNSLCSILPLSPLVTIPIFLPRYSNTQLLSSLISSVINPSISMAS